MAFSVSPSVQIVEKDLSSIIPEPNNTIGAFVGRFDAGPIDVVTEISSARQLFEVFGKPAADERGVDWWACANFLAYSDKLKVVRVDETKTNLTNVGVAAGIITDFGGATAAIAVQNSTDGTLASSMGYAAGDGADDHYAFIRAKEIGSRGNSLRVVVYPAGPSGGLDGAGVVFDPGNPANASQYGIESFGGPSENIFSYVPTSTPRIFNAFTNGTYSGYTQDEMHIAVVDHDGTFSGNQLGLTGEVLEIFQGLSKIRGVTDLSGKNLYYKDVINTDSNFIKIDEDTTKSIFGPSGGDPFFDEFTTSLVEPFGGSGDDGKVYNARLAGGIQAGNTYSYEGKGSDTTANALGALQPNVALVKAAYDKHFKDPLIHDIDLIIGGGAEALISKHIIELAEDRKDCVAFISPPANVLGTEFNDVSYDSTLTGLTADAVINYRNTQAFNSSYAVMDSGWKYQFDQFNDKFRWFPLNPDVAGLVAETENTTVPFFSPAGFNRGKVKNVVRLAYNPAKAERDRLYANGINPVVTFPGDGTVLFGDKTLQRRASALDRINVRRLLVVLEKAISTAAKFQLFEQNDAFTRRSFISQITPFLRRIQSQRGIVDFRIVCDETNNPSSVVESNRFVADILIKPTLSINFITLNFSVLRQDASFTEIVG
jgi:hypothetical protein